MAGSRPFRFGTDVWDPTHRFETSWLLTPWLLFFFRALISLYIFTAIIFILAWQCARGANGCEDSRDEFSYFTSLTYWGLGFYFLIAAVHTFTYARSGVPLLDRFPRPLQALHSAFYTTVVVYPFVVTIVYWARLYSGTWFAEVFDGWSNVSQHLLNSVFALFEIVVPRTDVPPPVHMTWLILVLALYLALAYVTKASKDFYPYDFLDPSKQHGLVAAYVFGIAVGCLIVFGLVWGAIWLRKHITERKLGKEGKFASRPEQSGVVKEDVEMAQPQEKSLS
ncbi:3336fe03-9d75-4b07-8f89-7c39311b9523 [Thermothielavioides terrestris]|nr:3336fe03-9d75-4b07-8f89-7c39311b9523 [Thermothielavioides terrestris]